ncbi:glycosyltransferase family 2 protein [Agromyces sp. G08B096]|uniref:Glycosyltransferase family 2 protein n=1 Tax=Agromyces sp. G08B096 TaxID=3156399 RepID=A0AAU7W5T7_9MICO
MGDVRDRALRVSVVVATHNGTRFLESQLRSILRQQRPIDEVVLSDDASTDGTIELARATIESYRDPTHQLDLVVLTNPIALGVTRNFERGMRAATGDLIALSDQDDIWRPDRVERAVQVFRERPDVLLVASDAELIGADDAPLGRRLLETLGVDERTLARLGADSAARELLRRNLVTGATMVVRRQLVERATPFPVSWVHDEWLAIVAAASGRMVVLPDALIGYRQHDANQIGVSRASLRDRMSRLRTPRTPRNARLLARAGALAARAPEIASGDEAFIAAAIDKLGHEQVRSTLPAPRLRRVLPVLREQRTGRYSAYGNGPQDVLRDLVQPR